MKRMKTHPTLLAWRTAKGWTQTQAAEYLGLTQSLYGKVEAHDVAPRPKRGKAISDKTGVSFESVMGVA